MSLHLHVHYMSSLMRLRITAYRQPFSHFSYYCNEVEELLFHEKKKLLLLNRSQVHETLSTWLPPPEEDRAGSMAPCAFSENNPVPWATPKWDQGAGPDTRRATAAELAEWETLPNQDASTWRVATQSNHSATCIPNALHWYLSFPKDPNPRTLQIQAEQPCSPKTLHLQ